MNRRKFIIYSSTGSALLGAGALNPWPLNQLLSQAMAAEICFELSIEEVMVPVFPTSPPIYMWAFRRLSPRNTTYTAYDLATDPLHQPPPVPGPVLTVREGDTICLSVTNMNTNQAGAVHSFAIARRPFRPDPPAVLPDDALPEPDIVYQGPDIPYGQTVEFKFTAPTAGTYLYFDPLQNPINRIMGLHGALVVLPAGALPAGGNSPYSNPTDAIQHLFADLGTAAGFFAPNTAAGSYTPDSYTQDRVPGQYWDGGDPHRNFTWVFNQIDEVHVNNPLKNGATLNRSQVRKTFLPRYFTINGRTGFDSAHADENRPVGHIGEPVLIRCLNAGLATHAPHIHGNHVFVLVNKIHADFQLALAENVNKTDAFDVAPLEAMDVLHAYRQPPNIFPWPPSRAQFGLKGMVYPMHCHNEISASAAGGNYPQGAITDWVLLGPHQTRKIKI